MGEVLTVAEYDDEVRRDIRVGLGSVGFEVDPAEIEIIARVQGEVTGSRDAEDVPVGVAAGTVHWLAPAEHVSSASGHPTTGGTVSIEGMTIVFEGSRGLRFLRVIDWASVDRQLGFVLETRPLAPLTLDDGS